MKLGQTAAMFIGGFLLGSALVGAGGNAVAGVTVTDVAPPSPPPAPAVPATAPGRKATLPLVIYGNGATGVPYTPSGWMGNTSAVGFNDQCRENPHSGTACMKLEYKAAGEWGGIVWQDPPDDWGDRDGGYNLTGATRLTFWARGSAGGEKAEFYFGVIKSEKPFPDSDNSRIAVTLTKDWKQYYIDLTGKNLNHIKTGFGWSVAGQGAPITFYLDDIQYE